MHSAGVLHSSYCIKPVIENTKKKQCSLHFLNLNVLTPHMLVSPCDSHFSETIVLHFAIKMSYWKNVQ